MLNPLKLAKFIKEGTDRLNELNAAVHDVRPDLSPAECRELTVQIVKEMVTTLFAVMKDHPDQAAEEQLDLVMTHIKTKYGPVLTGVAQ